MLRVYIVVTDKATGEAKTKDTKLESLRSDLYPLLCGIWGPDDFNNMVKELENYDHSLYDCAKGEVCSAIPFHPTKKIKICFVED
jgi:hypothetical protein